MSTGTKAKAFRVRGYYMDVPARSGSDTPATVTIDCPGLFVPDGAPIPLPADVRRVLRAAGSYFNAEYGGGYRRAMLTALESVFREHERAEKRRKGGGK